MRISVDEQDIGFDPKINTYKSSVYLNGELCHNAITADEEAGMVICWVFKDRTQRKILFGDVKINVVYYEFDGSCDPFSIGLNDGFIDDINNMWRKNPYPEYCKQWYEYKDGYDEGFLCG